MADIKDTKIDFHLQNWLDESQETDQSSVILRGFEGYRDEILSLVKENGGTNTVDIPPVFVVNVTKAQLLEIVKSPMIRTAELPTTLHLLRKNKLSVKMT